MNDIQKLRAIANRPKEKPDYGTNFLVSNATKYSPKKLKATWTIEFSNDLTAIYDEETMKDWTARFSEEIDKEILKNIDEEVTNNLIIVDDE